MPNQELDPSSTKIRPAKLGFAAIGVTICLVAGFIFYGNNCGPTMPMTECEASPDCRRHSSLPSSELRPVAVVTPTPSPFPSSRPVNRMPLMGEIERIVISRSGTLPVRNQVTFVLEVRERVLHTFLQGAEDAFRGSTSAWGLAPRIDAKRLTEAQVQRLIAKYSQLNIREDGSDTSPCRIGGTVTVHEVYDRSHPANVYKFDGSPACDFGARISDEEDRIVLDEWANLSKPWPTEVVLSQRMNCKNISLEGVNFRCPTGTVCKEFATSEDARAAGVGAGCVRENVAQGGGCHFQFECAAGLSCSPLRVSVVSQAVLCDPKYLDDPQLSFCYPAGPWGQNGECRGAGTTQRNLFHGNLAVPWTYRRTGSTCNGVSCSNPTAPIGTPVYVTDLNGAGYELVIPIGARGPVVIRAAGASTDRFTINGNGTSKYLVAPQGSAEICGNNLDDNINGVVDEGCD